MNQTNTVMLAIFVALGVVLVAGLVVIPALHEAQAISQQGESSRLLSRSNPGQTRQCLVVEQTQNEKAIILCR